jgi:hypothetical protein
MVSLALIPPHALQFDSIEPGATYLLLPQFFEDPTYRAYVKQAIETCSLSILDNGAFENVEGFPAERLASLAEEFGIKEIVIPDVLGDRQGTVDRLIDFALRDLDDLSHPKPRHMAVVQGTSYDDCRRCIDQMVEIKDEYALVSLKGFGIPKHLGKTTEGNEITRSSIRLRLANYIHSKYEGRFQVHFLGANPAWIGELLHLQTYRVRSIDTSLPYVYGLQGLDLNDQYVQDNVDLERHEEYFDFVPDDEQLRLIRGNIEFMKRVLVDA